MTFFSTTITPTTTPQLILANKAGITKVTQLAITVRDMGTATYIGIGGLDSQDLRLTGVGSAISFDTPQGKRYLDPTTLFIVSDTADAVVEIVGDTFV